MASIIGQETKPIKISLTKRVAKVMPKPFFHLIFAVAKIAKAVMGAKLGM
jgi:hypothetical protein